MSCIEFGLWPTRLAPADLALIWCYRRGRQPCAARDRRWTCFLTAGCHLNKSPNRHDLREQHIEIERSVFSDHQLSMYHGDGDSSGLSSPMSGSAAREMTLKFTHANPGVHVTPDEDQWFTAGKAQQQQSDILAADDEGAASAVSVVTGAATTTAAPRGQKQIRRRDHHCWFCGCERRHPRRRSWQGLLRFHVMKRVFGKLKKNKTNGSSVMITSPDFD